MLFTESSALESFLRDRDSLKLFYDKLKASYSKKPSQKLVVSQLILLEGNNILLQDPRVLKERPAGVRVIRCRGRITDHNNTRWGKAKQRFIVQYTSELNVSGVVIFDSVINYYYYPRVLPSRGQMPVLTT